MKDLGIDPKICLQQSDPKHEDTKKNPLMEIIGTLSKKRGTGVWGRHT